MRITPLCLALILPVAAAAQTFANPTFVPTPTQPDTLAVGDLNGDGYPDIVYANRRIAPGVVHVLLGQANGSFKAAADVQTNSQLGEYCLLTDVNGDGKPDLLCASAGSNNVFGITPGNGDGTFGATQLISVAPISNQTTSEPYVLTTGDVNGDGKTDLIVGNAYHGLWVLLNNGSGGYSTTQLSYPGTAPGQDFGNAQLKDLNGDGKLDLVVQDASNPEVFVYLNNGSGGFGAPATYSNTGDFVLADADGDGHVDLIGGNPGAPAILHGNADGTFSTTPEGTFSIPPSDPINATFLTAGSATELEYLSAVAYMDVNGDGIPDILARSGDGLAVMLGHSGLGFDSPQHLPVGQGLGYLLGRSSALADMNKDGKLDMVAAGPGGIYITYGLGNGQFQSAVTYSSGKFVDAAGVADFNGDGKPDVITNGDTQLNLSLGNGNGTFGPSTPTGPTLNDGGGANGEYSYYTVYGGGVSIGDFNGDGKQDVIEYKEGTPTSTGIPFSAVLIPGNGNGTFGTPLPAPAKPYNSSYVGKLFGSSIDGFVSISEVQTGPASGTAPAPVAFSVNAYLGQSSGTFLPVTTPFENTSDVISDATIGQFTAGSTSLGLAVGVNMASGGSKVAFLSGQPGALTEKDVPVSLPIYPHPNMMAAGDFDGDGKVDLAYFSGNPTNPASFKICVLYNNGLPATLPTVTCTASPSGYVPNQIFAKDMDGDGIADLVMNLGTQINDQVLIWHGAKNRTFTTPQTMIPGEANVDIVVADVNGDKLPDVVGGNLVSNSFTVALQLPSAHATGTLTASPEPSATGQAFTITAKLTPPSADASTPLTGSVTFAVDGTTIGSAALANNTASIAGPTNLSVGSHALTASWPGMTTPVSIGALQLTGTHVVQTGATVVKLGFAPNPVTAGQNGTLTASVVDSPNQPDKTITGTLTVTDSVTGKAVATFTGATLSAGGTAQVSFATPGTHTLTGTYSGDSAHTGSNAAVNVQVTVAGPATTATTLSANPNPAYVGQTIKVTISVTGSAPTGTVQLTSNGAAVGGPVTLANGSASASVPTTAPGVLQFQAVYSGDANNTGSTSGVLSVQVLAAGFTVTPAGDITLKAGRHTTSSVTVTSTSLSGTVALAVPTAPEWLTIRFTPEKVAVTPGSSAKVSMYVDTDSVLQFYSQNHPAPPPSWAPAGRVLAVLLLLSPAAFSRTRRKLRGSTLLAWLMLAALPVLGGCGTGVLPKTVAPGDYTISVVGYGSNGQQQTGTFRLHVTP